MMGMDAAQHHEQNLHNRFTLCTQLYSLCRVVKNPYSLRASKASDVQLISFPAEVLHFDEAHLNLTEKQAALCLV